MLEPSAEKSIAIQLARERSREAAERTLMAWIRTALALIGFGFTIAKFHDYLEQSDLQLAVDACLTLFNGKKFEFPSQTS